MTTPRDLRELDETPTPPWRPVSSEWARRQAREAVEQAVRSAKERRGAKFGSET